MKTKGLTLLCLMLLLCRLVQAAPETPDADTTDHAPSPPLVLNLFYHDQLEPREIASLGPDYLAWFIKELTQVTGRRIEVISLSRIPDLTDLGYRQDDALASLSAWDDRVRGYIEKMNLPKSTRRHKYVLITRHNINAEVLGIAFPTKGVAIASIKAYNTLGHEIGHLFGAVHEHAETRLAAFPPCRTLMYPEHTLLIANCFVFSEKNRQTIHQDVNGKPD